MSPCFRYVSMSFSRSYLNGVYLQHIAAAISAGMRACSSLSHSSHAALHFTIAFGAGQTAVIVFT